MTLRMCRARRVTSACSGLLREKHEQEADRLVQAKVLNPQFGGDFELLTDVMGEAESDSEEQARERDIRPVSLPKDRALIDFGSSWKHRPPSLRGQKGGRVYGGKTIGAWHKEDLFQDHVPMQNGKRKIKIPELLMAGRKRGASPPRAAEETEEERRARKRQRREERRKKKEKKEARRREGMPPEDRDAEEAERFLDALDARCRGGDGDPAVSRASQYLEQIASDGGGIHSPFSSSSAVQGQQQQFANTEAVSGWRVQLSALRNLQSKGTQGLEPAIEKLLVKLRAADVVEEERRREMHDQQAARDALLHQYRHPIGPHMPSYIARTAAHSIAERNSRRIVEASAASQAPPVSATAALASIVSCAAQMLAPPSPPPPAVVAALATVAVCTPLVLLPPLPPPPDEEEGSSSDSSTSDVPLRTYGEGSGPLPDDDPATLALKELFARRAAAAAVSAPPPPAPPSSVYVRPARRRPPKQKQTGLGPLLLTVAPGSKPPLVQSVVPGGNVARAGVQVGDRIARVDFSPVKTREQLVKELDGKEAGSLCQLSLWRTKVDQVRGTQLETDEFEVTVVLRKAPGGWKQWLKDADMTAQPVPKPCRDAKVVKAEVLHMRKVSRMKEALLREREPGFEMLALPIADNEA
eukprot:Hpha_TRINITY_DN3139_c0_g1::TRINITY_DN3139_c0_g1_i2::g.96653::m.96653